jgi:hypothetical protein
MAGIGTRQKATRVVDSATVDVLVGRTDGEAGYRRVDVQVAPLVDGSLRIQAEVPSNLAGPVRQLIAALGVRPKP